MAAELRTAALDTGFFYVANHGVPQDLIQNQFLWSKRFFDQPWRLKTPSTSINPIPGPVTSPWRANPWMRIPLLT